MHQQLGHTLISSLSTVAVLATLSLYALADLGPSGERARLRAAQSQLVGALQMARSTAASSGRQIVLCPSLDGARCDSGNDWSWGWLAWRDDNQNRRFDPGESLLWRDELDLRGPTIHSTEGRRQIVYRATGTSGGSNVRFRLCGPAAASEVIVANSGRIRIAGASPETCGS
jgi:type IV fimbrial biogenesis protein FimT